MILSDRTIRGLATNCGLIEPFDEDQLQPCSYDVRLDSRIKRFVKTNDSAIHIIDGLSKELRGVSMLPTWNMLFALANSFLDQPSNQYRSPIT